MALAASKFRIAFKQTHHSFPLASCFTSVIGRPILSQRRCTFGFGAQYRALSSMVIIRTINAKELLFFSHSYLCFSAGYQSV